jgi:hypothetical protein
MIERISWSTMRKPRFPSQRLIFSGEHWRRIQLSQFEQMLKSFLFLLNLTRYECRNGVGVALSCRNLCRAVVFSIDTSPPLSITIRRHFTHSVLFVFAVCINHCDLFCVNRRIYRRPHTHIQTHIHHSWYRIVALPLN